MDHHGLYTDISNSFPVGANGTSGGLPSTNVKYHHHLPQIPPQPPPQQQAQGVGQQIYLPGSYGGQSQQQQQQQHQQQQQVQGGQLQQQQQQHVEPDPIGCGLFTDTAGLFDPASALCTNNISSNSFSTNNNHQGANNSKTVEFTSRKFETNTGDSITYNINNINTNIVNNISGGSLGTGGVQAGINQAQTIVGATTDFLGGTQFATSTGGVGGGSGNTQISFNKDGDSNNPTIINISNNNHNIMAPPYPYSYPTKISGMGALNELNSKFGANHSWSTGSANAAGTTTVGGHEFGHENTVISNFESKNPNKYHTSRSSYRQDYTAAQQQQYAAHYQHKQAQQPTTHYQPSYGLYHPEGAQATPMHQPNGHHHGYHEPFAHIVRSKYPTTTEEASRYGRSHHHQHSSTNHSQTHHDLMYNERSRHTTNYATGYVPPTPGSYYTSHQPSTKGIIGPNLEFFNSGYIKQMPTINHHYLPPNRHAYATQPTAHHNYHHQNYPINPNTTYEDPYHHRSRIPAIPTHHYKDLHAQQQYANYPNASSNLGYHQTQPHQQVFNKTFTDYGAPNVALNPSNHYNNPTTPTVHHQPNHYGIKYTSQTIVPPMTQPRSTNSSSSSQQPHQKPTQPTNNTYYTTPNAVSFDLNHPLIDLEDQINSVKILKTNREPTVPQTFDSNHAINYDCHQKYMMNRYLAGKPNPHHSIPDANGYIPNGLITNNGNNTAHPTNFGYTTMEDLGLGTRGFTLDENLKDKNLRDYLSSWNETEEEEEKKEANNNQLAHQNFESCKYLQEALEEQLPPLPHSGVIVANVQNGNLPDILIDLDKPKDEPQPKTETEVGERLYILETYDVPHSELNKYKHLSVINELPKNVVPIHDSADSLKFLEEIESNRDKYYQTELESEVVYDDRKKEDDKKESTDQTVPEAVQESEPIPAPKSPEQVKQPEPQAEEVEDTFKVPRHLPKYRKRQRHVEQQQYDYPRFPKKARRSSIEDFLYCDKPKQKVPIVPKRYNAKQLLTLCVAALNSREYRRYAKANIARREELAKEVEERKRVEEQKQVEQQKKLEEAPMEVEVVEDAVPMETAHEESEKVVDLTKSLNETAVEIIKDWEDTPEEEEPTVVEGQKPVESNKQGVESEDVDNQEAEAEAATQNTITENTEKCVEDVQECVEITKEPVEDAPKRDEDVQECVESIQEFVESTQDCVEDARDRVKDTQECVEVIQKYVDSTQECTEKVQEPVEDVQECVEDIQKFAENTQQCVENTPEGVEDTPECVEDIQEFVENTQQCFENTPEGVEDTPECVEDIQEYVENTQQCVDNAPKRVEDTPECVEDLQEYVENTKESAEDAQERVEDIQECVENIQEYVDNTKKCDEEEQECVENIQEYVDSTQECVEGTELSLDATPETEGDAVCDIAEEQSMPDADQSDEDDDDVFERPTSITNRVSVIVEEARQVTTPPEVSVIEGQRVPVIQRLESVEVMEVEQVEEAVREEFNPGSLMQLASEAFERYSQVYDYQRVPPLRSLCYENLLTSGLLPQPDSLQKLCEQFICNNRQLFIIEEVRHEPERLQDMCQKVVNETNIIIDMNDFCIMTNDELAKQDKEEEGRVFIVEDNHGSIVDLLREDDEDEAGTEVIEISEDHEIFLGAMEAGDDGIRVVLESNHSDSENEIYRKVEQEIEKMMTTSSDEDDEGVKGGVMDEQELQNEFFSFVGDDCIQYEEVVPVNKVAYRRESLINDLRERYVGSKEGTFNCRMKLLRKYVYYQRYIKLKDQRVASKKRFFRKRLACLEKKIAAMRRKTVFEEVDSDSNSSMSSVSSSSSSSTSVSSNETSSSSSSDSDEVVTEVETFQQSGESASEETSNQSEEPMETNNNQVEELPKPAQLESQQFAKEQEDSNSSDSRSRGQLRRSPNVLPLAKKKKLSFEESLLNIEQIYKKSGSPTPSSIGSPNSSNSSSSNSNSRPMSRRFSTNCRPNVIVNVNNNREAPRKLFIPSYKIFDQSMSTKLPQLSVEPSRSLSRSSSGSSSSSSSASTKQVTTSTQRSSGLIRVNYPKKTSSKEDKVPAKSSPRSRAAASTTNGRPDLDHRIPFVRLERIDYVEQLAEQYRKQQLQQDQQTKFSKLRQRRKSTFS